MKEAIHLKKSQGLEVDVSDSDEEREKDIEEDVVVFSEYHQHHDENKTERKEEDEKKEKEEEKDEDSDDDDWLNEDTVETKESITNAWLDSYCREFEVQLEMYFPYEQKVRAIYVFMARVGMHAWGGTT